MNKPLLNLIKFINERNPEIHYDYYGEKGIVMFVNALDSEEFFAIVNFIDEEGYELRWKGNYFAIQLDDFIDCECDIDIEDFAVLINLKKGE